MRTIRPLQLSDKKDILEICKHSWEGDWVPSRFETWLEDEACHTISIEVNGRIAALANLRIIDDGKTGWMEGLRVHPDFQGKGLATIITDNLVRMARDIGTKRIRYTTASVNEKSLHLALKSGMTKLFEHGVYWQNQIEEIPWTFPEHDIEKLDIDQEFSLLEKSNLIPRGILIIDWKAMDFTLTALRSFDDVECWVHRDGDSIKSISIGTTRHDVLGSLWGFTIYAENEMHFLEHFSHHLDRARSNRLTRIEMIFPLEFSNMLYNFEWIDKDSEGINAVLLEREF